MSCDHWQVIRRPEYIEDLNAIEQWIAQDNPLAGIDMWLHIDEQVEQLADCNFPRRPSQRVANAFELVAHKNYIVYFDQHEPTCTVTVRTVVHVARVFPPLISS
jgi:plasmid stabilization system protein ParE